MTLNPWRSSSIRSALEGRSFIDAKRIHIRSLHEASEFLASYGYDVTDADDYNELMALKEEAIQLIDEELLKDGEAIPQALIREEDIRHYLLMASSPRTRELGLWSGALLRVIHTLAHSHSHLNDLYFHDIREQIFSRFKDHVKELETGYQLGELSLENFELRPEKTRRSVAMKLMHKRENVAADIFDWIGIRFITHYRADVLDVLAYLRNHHIITYANIKPSRTRNTLIDLGWLNKKLSEGVDISELKLLMQDMDYPSEQESLSDNPYSNVSYHSVQLTCRQRIKIHTSDQKKVAFFFPFEIQIMDKNSYQKTREGLASHKEYKRRQRAAVRRRILPFLKS